MGALKPADLLPVLPGFTSLQTVAEVRSWSGLLDYLHVTEWQNSDDDVAATKPQFNTRENVKTRSVTISGVEIRWEQANLLRYSGESVTDLESLEIYADRLVISSPLRFPGTTVTIYARVLEFHMDGCIDTSPIAFAAPASAAHHSSDGIPADAAGNPTYQAANGKHGEPAGDINLYVKSITSDAPMAGNAKLRFICRGSNGQTPEAGGRKRFIATDKQPSKTLQPIALDTIHKYINKQWVEKRPEKWRWPDLTELVSGNVVHVKLIACDDDFIAWNYSLTYFPSEASVPIWGHHVDECMKDPFDESKTDPSMPRAPKNDASRLRPLNGEDAYPSGAPGRGGPGGNVVSRGFDVPKVICDTACGTGAVAPAVSGGEAGGPVPAYWMTIKIVKSSLVESERAPEKLVTPVTASPGSSTPEQTAESGVTGAVRLEAAAGTAWIHPVTLGSVVNCATDAFRNGYREAADALLRNYAEPLSAAVAGGTQLPGELFARQIEIEALRNRLRANVDYYGHPPGWVPRLDAKSNFIVMENIRRIASDVLYYASTAERNFDRLANRSRVLDNLLKAKRMEFKADHEAIGPAYQEVCDAKTAFDGAMQKLADKQQVLADLSNKVETKARDKVQEQRLFKGFLKIVSGIATAIPVGQPYLGLAGGVVDTIADADWNAESWATEVGKTAQRIGGDVDTYLEKNKELFTSGDSDDRAASLARQVEDLLAADNVVDEKRRAVAMTLEEPAIVRRLVTKLELHVKKGEGATPLEWSTGEKEELSALKPSIAGLDDHISDRDLLAKLKDHAEALDAQRAHVVAQLKAKGDAAEAEAKKSHAQREQLLKSLSGLGTGITRAGGGIATAFAPVKADDDEVQKVRKELLKSEFKREYAELTAELDKLGAVKKASVERLESAQRNIGQLTARLASGLTAMSTLSTQWQHVGRALDPSVVQYLRGMQQRSQDTLRAAVYHFAKAFQYECLEDIPDEYFNLDAWVKRLQEFERAGDEALYVRNAPLSKERFSEIEKVVVAEQNALLAARMSQLLAKAPYTNDLTFELTKLQRDELQARGRLTLNLVDSGTVLSLNDVDGRIENVELTAFVLGAAYVGSPNVRIDVRHAGESAILWGRNDPVTSRKAYHYFYFRGDRDELPVSWGFNYEHVSVPESTTTGKITADKVSPRQAAWEALVKRLLGDTSDWSFTTYFPSYFAGLTIVLNPGRPYQGIGPIDKVALKVSYSNRGTVDGSGAVPRNIKEGVR